MCLHDRSPDKKKIDLIRWANRQRRFLAQIRAGRVGGIGVIDDAAGPTGPFDLSRYRRTTSNPDRLVRLFLYRGPILLVAAVHTSAKHTRVYLRHQAVVVRPCLYPIRRNLRPRHLAINRNLHCSDQLSHASLRSIYRVILAAQPLSYSSWRRHQMPFSLRPLGARSSHWYMPQRPSTPRE